MDHCPLCGSAIVREPCPHLGCYDVPVEHCRACDEAYIDDVAGRAIDAARRAHRAQTDPLHDRPHIERGRLLRATTITRRVRREERLRALGYDVPSSEQRRANLALYAALKPWPR